jgi:hypothetical protein
MFRKLALAAAAATITAAGAASAADLPSKKSVPALVAEEGSAIHGFMDIGYADGRVTGGGNPLYKSGAVLFQSDVGVAVDLYKSKTGFINSASVFAGIWVENLTNPAAHTKRMQEYDWWAGASVGFADYYKLTVQSLQFQLQHTDPTTPGAQVVVKNATASLSYDDAHLGLPIALNPSVSVIYNFNGGVSLMPLGKTDTYRVDLAIAPGYSFQKSAGIPLSFSVPTSISTGPKDEYYVATVANRVCGAAGNAVCSTSTFEMFSTGLQAKYDLGQIVPKKFGAWTAKAGVQYYQYLNDAVKANQGVAVAARKSNSTVVSAGLGVSF